MIKKFDDKRTFQTSRELDWVNLRNKELQNLSANIVAESPFVYFDRRMFAQIIAKIEIFKLAKNIQGSIVECGVHRGNSLMLFMHLCSVFSPVSFNKKIIGFDSFAGFKDISNKDPNGINDGDMGDVDYEHLSTWVKLQQENNIIPHVNRVELISGLAEDTIPKYINDNPHLIVSLLYLDFDLYKPTLVALKNIVPLMPKGAIIAFDQLNQKKWHGETLAVKEFLKINNLKLKVFDFEPHISYVTLGE